MDKIRASGSTTSSIERWTDGIALGAIAQTLAVWNGVGTQAKKHRELLQHRLDALCVELNLDNDSSMRVLPLSTLRALSHNLLAQRYPGGRPLVERAKESLNSVVTSPKDGTPAPAAAARLLAHLCLEGTCSASFIVRCAKTVLSSNWAWALREESWKKPADHFLDRLRAQSTLETVDTLSRMQELHALTLALPSPRPNWALVENAIFHLLFAWPALVDDSVEPLYECLSLPVAVDIVFDSKNEVRETQTGDVALLDVKWRDQLRQSMDAAKRLWRSKHGGIPTDFRDRAMSASVTWNFSIAQRVVDRTPFAPQLFDGSMIPYFSQVILHRLLGRSLGFSCAVIGNLGERRAGKDGTLGLDYELKGTGYADRKLTYVFQTEMFSSVVHSPDEPPEIREQARLAALADHTFTEVNVCPYLSNVADVVQPRGWRHQHYKRCPDVLRLVHLADQELLPADNPEVIEIGKILSTNQKSILRLPETAGVLAFASYLHNINGAVRESLSPFTPPSLSWSFIRAAEQENDRKFWHTVWHTIGGRADDFLRLRHATSAAGAARYLAGALNTFSPTEVCLSHRAPDLLIVLNHEALVPSSAKEDAADYRTHLFDSVIDALGQCDLLPTPIEAMRRFIGQTRVVVMRAGGTEVVGRLAKVREEIGREYLAALVRLSTFRFGFTQQMAKVLLAELGHKGLTVRELLDTLVDTGHLGYAAGEYWVVGRFGNDLTAAWSPQVRAQRNWAAAKAFAPYMAVTERALQVDLNSAFVPEAVHEAQIHAELARRAETIRVSNLPFSHPERKLLNAISAFKGRMLRFVELPTPGIVNELTKDHAGLSSVAAWELAQELLEEKSQLGAEPTPQERSIYARAAASWFADVRNDPKVDPGRKVEILGRILELYDAALDETEATPEARARRLSVLTHYGEFLHRYGDREGANRNTLASVREEVKALTAAGVRSAAVQAKYFEVEGDSCSEPLDATRWYQLMTVMSQKYRPGWVKLAGTDLSSGMIADIEAKLRREGLLEETVTWAIKQTRFPIKSGLDSPLVRQRWIAGVDALRVAAAAHPVRRK